MKGSSFRSAGACPLGVEGRARQDERLGPWNEQLGSSLYGAEALPLVLKGELVRRSDWAHGMSSWARLCKV